MYFVFGTRLYGKVDEIPGGMFHVATKFFHVNYLPLVPTGSLVVLESTGDGWRGADVSLSFKSWMTAWLRAAMYIGAFAGPLMLFFAFVDKPDIGLAVGGLLVTALSAGGLYASYTMKGWRYATYARAHELVDALGGAEELRIAIDLAYGVADEDQAKAAFQGLAQKRSEEQGEEPEKIDLA